MTDQDATTTAEAVVSPATLAIVPEALIDLETLKIALNIDPTNDTEDELLTYLVNLAAARVEADTRRPLAWRSMVRSFDGPPGSDLRLPLYPITKVTAITLADGAPLSWWLVDVDQRPPTIDVYVYARSGIARVRGSWPTGLAAITVDWEGGYGGTGGLPIPSDLQEASVLMAADGYQTRKLGTWNSMNLALAGQTLSLSPDMLWRRYRTCLNYHRELTAG